MIGGGTTGDRPGLGRTAAWLGLAASPAFALMGLLTAAQSGGPTGLVCGTADGALGGMAPMYALMSVVHAAPWLRLGARRRQRRPAD